MAKKVKPIPEGYHTVTPHLVIDGASEAIEFYQKAFNAKLMFREDRPDGKVMHAEMKIGNSVIMLADECAPHPGHEENCAKSPASLKGTTVGLFLYVDDVDAVFNSAVSAGAAAAMPVTDMFWGDRMGGIKDPFGHIWNIATRKEIVPQEEMEKRAKEFMSSAKT